MHVAFGVCAQWAALRLLPTAQGRRFLNHRRACAPAGPVLALLRGTACVLATTTIAVTTVIVHNTFDVAIAIAIAILVIASVSTTCTLTKTSTTAGAAVTSDTRHGRAL